MEPLFLMLSESLLVLERNDSFYFFPDSQDHGKDKKKD